MVKTKVISNVNAYQTYIDALDNPCTRKNYEIHFDEFRKALKASKSCNELLVMDGRELGDKIVTHIKEIANDRSTSRVLTMAA